MRLYLYRLGFLSSVIAKILKMNLKCCIHEGCSALRPVYALKGSNIQLTLNGGNRKAEVVSVIIDQSPILQQQPEEPDL